MTTDQNISFSSGNQSASSEADWFIQPVGNDDQNDMVALTGEHHVGRKDCEITLHDPHSSRQHAKFSLVHEELRLEDLGSANGTFVNEEKIESVLLKNGDIVRFDKQAFSIIGPDDSAKTMLRPAAPKVEIKTPSDEIPFSAEDLIAEQSGKKARDRGASPASSKTGNEAKIDKSKDGLSSDNIVRENPVEMDLNDLQDLPVENEIHKAKEVDVDKPEDEHVDEDGTRLMSRKASSDDLLNQNVDSAVKRPIKAENIKLEHEQAAGNRTRKISSKASSNNLQDLIAESELKRANKFSEQSAISSLVIMTGKAKGHSIELSQDIMTIGRKGADIPLDETSISTKHAQVIKQGGKWKLVDLMSANSVYVNGKKTQSTFLVPGDVIRIGRIELQFSGPKSAPRPTEQLQNKNKDQVPRSAERNVENSLPGWLYIALGFGIVLVIGAYVMSSI